MPLTPDEQAQLDILQGTQNRQNADAAGQAALAQAGSVASSHSDDAAFFGNQAPAETSLPKPPSNEGKQSPWSWTRMFLGMGTDFINNTEGLLQDVGRATGLYNALGYPNPTQTPNPVFAPLEGEKNAPALETGIRRFLPLVFEFGAFTKVFGAARTLGELGEAAEAAPSILSRISTVAKAGAATDLLQNPQLNNFADTIRNVTGIDNSTLQWLSTENDPDTLTSRLKAAATNIPVNAATEGLFQLLGKGIQVYRAVRGGFEDSNAIVKAAAKDYGLPTGYMEETAADAAAHAEEQKALSEVPEGAQEGPRRAPEAEPEPELQTPERPFNPATDVTGANQPKSFEDVTQFLANKAGDLNVTPEALRELGERLLDNPGSALKDLGIDVKNLPIGAIEDPEALGRMVEALGEVHDTLANRLGRTGTVVSADETATAGRYFATSLDTMKDLFGSIKNLPGKLFGARMISEVNRLKMVDSAQKALAVLQAKGDDTKEWADFSADFFRHAYINGMVTGAKSEIARALQSTQISLKQAVTAATKLSPKEASAATEAGDPLTGASRLLSDMTNPVDRQMFLQRVLEKAQDGGALSRFARVKTGTLLTQIIRESKGNLWTLSTAAKIFQGSLSMFGLETAAKSLVALGRLTAAPFSAQQADAARRAVMSLWAYSDGVPAAWTAAWRSAWAVMEKTSLENLVPIADSMGLRDIAQNLASKTAEVAKNIGDPTGYLRPDIVDSHVIGLSGSKLDALNQKIDDKVAALGLPEAMSTALKVITRTGATALNVAGAATRIPNTLVTVPDNFIILLRQRAGAQAYAVQLAAQQAAESGLTGKALTAFMKAKVVQLTETATDGISKYDPVLAGEREAALAQGTAEGQHVLFHDDPVTKIGEWATNLGSNGLVSLIAPVVKTITKIVETSTFDYILPGQALARNPTIGPMIFTKAAIRQALNATPQQRDEALARMAIGVSAMYSAFKIADAYGIDRTVIGRDGGQHGSGREAGREPYSLKVGGDLINLPEGPLKFLLGAAADTKEILTAPANAHDPNAGAKSLQLLQAMFFSFVHTTLDSTMLTELSKISDLANAEDPKDFKRKALAYAGTTEERFIPGSGVARSIDKKYAAGFDARDIGLMQTLWDHALKALPFAAPGNLPPTRDMLGYPIQASEGERLLGIKAGIESTDPLRKELANLAFAESPGVRNVAFATQGIARVLKDPNQSVMNSDEFSRYLELRGHVVKADGVNTMEENLRNLIASPGYKALGNNHDAKVAAVSMAMQHYGRAAEIQLLGENPHLYSQTQQALIYNVGRLSGHSDAQNQATYENAIRQYNAKGHNLPIIPNTNQ